MASSLSPGGFSRLGASISILGTVRLGGNLEFLNTGGEIRGADQIRRISFPNDYTITGGLLHGTWMIDTTIQTSDEILKRRIAPLHHELMAHMARSKAAAAQGTKGSPGDQRASAVDWMLRQLRPVSFQLQEPSESKKLGGPPGGRLRYGFVAQEVERAVPNLVRQVGDHKALVYQDLIAIITLAAKDHQERLAGHRGEVTKLRDMVKTLADKMGGLQA